MIKTSTTVTPPQSLREAIVRAKLTIDQVVAKVGCSRKALMNWRNGSRPSDHYIGLLSEVLGVDLWPLYSHKEMDKKAQLIETPTFNSTVLLSNETYSQSQNRNPSSHIDEAMKMYISGQITQLWDNFHLTEEATSTITLRIALSSHINLLESLAAWSLPNYERAWLLKAMSDAAILSGRIARDQLNHEEAISRSKLALGYAIESTSGDQIIAATMRLAETMKDAGLHYEALSYCNTGIQQTTKASPRIRGELYGLTAELYGMMNLTQESERMMGEAASLAVGAANLPTAGGINFSETAAAEYQMYTALRQGDISQALKHIERGIKLLSVEFPKGHNIRWESHLWIDQAHAHNEANDIEAACNDLHQAATLAESISSRMAMKKVQEVARELSQRHTRPNPAIRSLHDELMQIQIH